MRIRVIGSSLIPNVNRVLCRIFGLVTGTFGLIIKLMFRRRVSRI